MSWQQAFYRLDFQYDLLLNDNIKPIAAFEGHGFVNDRQSQLPLEFDTGFFQFITEAFLISRFQQARPKRSMNLNGQTDDAFR